MIKKTIFLILTAILIVLGTFYFLQGQEKEEAIDKITDDITVEEEKEEEQVEEEGQEEEIEEEWNTFVNLEYSYTTQYDPDWEINSEDLERVWFYLPAQDASILFASATATQTGFPEYELISSYEFILDEEIETTISILESDETRAIISAFQSQEHPHFVMTSYEYQNEQHHENMVELNEEFLSKITFQ
jgi:hypothetical protein